MDAPHEPLVVVVVCPSKRLWTNDRFNGGPVCAKIARNKRKDHTLFIESITDLYRKTFY